jgi:hypothetical protein
LKIVHEIGDGNTEILSDWLLPPTREPAARCAATLVDRLNISPPVDVDILADHFCDVTYDSWPFACDAIVIGLDNDRPKVFMRKNGVGRRRRRFTLGHELGHVILPWHIGIPACVPLAVGFNTGPVGPAAAGDVFSPERISEQEGEANLFAGELLVPRRFLESLCGEEVADVVTELNRTDVSATAGILALARNLLPGFYFLIDEGEQGYRDIRSSGTRLPAISSSESREAQLRNASHGFGEVVLSDRRVLWFQLSSPTNFTLPRDERTTTQILRDSLAHAEGDSDLFMRINGIVGGMLSKEERAQNETQALSVLEHRFSADPQLRHFLEDSDFRLYLRRKAAERVKQ